MKKFFAWTLLKLFGWKIRGEKPPQKKYILIAAPHTSNWDFFFMKIVSTYLGMDISWMGKHTLFEGVLGWFLLKTGGLAIDRRSKHNVVEQITQVFNEKEELIVVIPAEGTRKYTEYWKSGFYHIAQSAKVPVVLGFLDYKLKEGGFGPAIEVTKNVSEDMDKIRDFYKDISAKFPENKSRIRLKQEDETQSEEASHSSE